MTYNPNIPQATDDPSDSQGDLINNFSQLNVKYGTSGDHYSWTNSTATENNMHAKVTLAALPSSNAPGNVLPTTITVTAPTSGGNCAIFAQSRDSQTTPFLTRNNITPTAPLENIWPLLPIKAYGLFLKQTQSVGGAAITIEPNAMAPNVSPLDYFNMTSVVQTTPSLTNRAKFTVTFENQMRGTNYSCWIISRNGVFPPTITSESVFSFGGGTSIPDNARVQYFIIES